VHGKKFAELYFMKSILTLIAFSILSAFTFQDGSWKIMHNGQTKLQSSVENESKNVVTINKADLSKSGVLAINFDEKPQPIGWVRVISLNDTEENVLSKHAGNFFRILNPTLKAMVVRDVADTIKIYSWATPVNPKDAANIRIRRVHLCTLVFK
jgi:hypothetical protein